MTGIPVTRIQRLEDPELSRYKVEPRLRDLAKLAWALGVEPNDLLDPRWLEGCGLEQPIPREIWKAEPADRA